MTELTARERAEIVDRYLRRETTREIANATGRSIETVRRVLKREGVFDCKRCVVLYDTSKQIKTCLGCAKPECDNCIERRRERRRKKEQ